MSDRRIASLRACYAGRLLTEPGDIAAHLVDWRKSWRGQAWAVAQPATTEEVASIVTWCAANETPVVCQGGNTGLSGGSVPDETGRALVLSLTRLARVREIDPLNNTITVEAGCRLADVQSAAAAAGRLFPLSLAAEGSCTIGGNLATNAGGTGVLRYGNARELCLGLEVVSANGDIWDGLRGLRKDNTGYDLRDLFVGSEGTLGVITAAVLKLFPAPQGRAVAVLAVETPRAAIEVFVALRAQLDASLVAFELFSDACLDLVLKHTLGARAPFGRRAAWNILVEVISVQDETGAAQALETALSELLERGEAVDAVVANSFGQRSDLWRLRESISEAQGAEGRNIKHDISLPISATAAFLEEMIPAVEHRWSAARVMAFGHVGDGNLHFNVSARTPELASELISEQGAINRLVHDTVAERAGSISAEHGLGVLRKGEAARYKPAVELRLMQAIKHALDPKGIMNPGKVLDTLDPVV